MAGIYRRRLSSHRQVEVKGLEDLDVVEEARAIGIGVDVEDRITPTLEAFGAEDCLRWVCHSSGTGPGPVRHPEVIRCLIFRLVD